MIEYVGFAAGTLTVASFLPQVIQAWKTKRVKDVSFWMLAMLMLGAAIWITYGVLKKDMPVIVTNVLALLLQASIMVAKLRFENHG